MKTIIFQNTQPEELENFLNRDDIKVILIQKSDNATKISFMEND